MRSSIAAGAVVFVTLAGSARADVLWNQLPYYDDPTFSLPSHPDLTSSDPFSGPFAFFGVSDVTVPAGGWTINSVTTYFSDLTFAPTTTSAVLNIFPKTGSLPLSTNDPRANLGQGTTVSISDIRSQGGTSQQPVMILTAAGLNINLAAGSYWIGLTPALPSDPFNGFDLHWRTQNVQGSPSATRYYDHFGPTAWDVVGPDQGAAAYDLALTINGVPAPASLGLLGLAGLTVIRRRR